jgi:hypothetical protein
MRTIIALAAALALAGCGGKSKDAAAEPGAEGACCCTTGDGREVLGETACTEAAGSCEPADACETEGVGGSDDEPPPEADPSNY